MLFLKMVYSISVTNKLLYCSLILNFIFSLICSLCATCNPVSEYIPTPTNNSSDNLHWKAPFISSPTQNESTTSVKLRKWVKTFPYLKCKQIIASFFQPHPATLPEDQQYALVWFALLNMSHKVIQNILEMSRVEYTIEEERPSTQTSK